MFVIREHDLSSFRKNAEKAYLPAPKNVKYCRMIGTGEIHLEWTPKEQVDRISQAKGPYLDESLERPLNAAPMGYANGMGRESLRLKDRSQLWLLSFYIST